MVEMQIDGLRAHLVGLEASADERLRDRHALRARARVAEAVDHAVPLHRADIAVEAEIRFGPRGRGALLRDRPYEFLHRVLRRDPRPARDGVAGAVVHPRLKPALLRLARRERDILPPFPPAELEILHRVVIIAVGRDFGTGAARDLEYHGAADAGPLHGVEVADDPLLGNRGSAPVPPDKRLCAGPVRTARRRARDQIVDHVAELRLRSPLDKHAVRSVPGPGPDVGPRLGVDGHRAALQAEVAFPPAHSGKHRQFVPRGTAAALFVPDLHAADERLRHRPRSSPLPRRWDSRQDIRAEVEVDEKHGDRAFADRLGGGFRVHPEVAFHPIRQDAAHRVPRLDLLRDEFAAGERRYAVGFRLQKAADVREESDGADRDGSVGRAGERAAVDFVRVRRGVGRGVAQRPLPRRDHVGEDFADAVELGAEPKADVPADAHRDVRASVLRVYRLAHSERRRTARGRHDGEDFAFSGVGERVEGRKRADVVVVPAHIGVEDDARAVGAHSRRRQRQESGICQS